MSRVIGTLVSSFIGISMTNAVIVHGSPTHEEYYDENYPSCSNSHWVPWLQKQLLIRNIPAATPEMPDAWNPQYPIWQREFERFDINDETILVGHSCGGGFLLRWLSEHRDVRVGKVILIAPWLDPQERRAPQFFEFDLDRKLASRTKGLIVMNSDNDIEEVQETVRIVLEELDDVDYREFHEYGHFCADDLGGDAFPELMELIVGA